MKAILFAALILSGMMSADAHTPDPLPSRSPVVGPEIQYAGSLASEEPIAATPVVQATETAAAEPILLRSVEELTLYDDRAAVIGKLGEPQGVTQDEFYSELVIYEYERLKVVFFGEYIQSIDIAEDVKEVLLDDRYVATTLTDLKEALGEPDYVAEDGIVFQRDEALLKVFLDEASGELSSISYYHLATV
ncbi:MAG: hypothetical protein K0Q63_2550 [Paenibacillus sp.]|jgi:hypothetical protein|nr:hypothetical protein [Paenibacillus sp.]